MQDLFAINILPYNCSSVTLMVSLLKSTIEIEANLSDPDLYSVELSVPFVDKR